MSEQPTLWANLPKAAARSPSEPIVRTALIEGGYRFEAKRAWGLGPCILWNLLNPSLADGKRDDPTMRRMIGFSYRWGFGSLIVVNMNPLISPTIDKLRAWRRDWNNNGSEGYRKYVFNTDVVGEHIKHADTVVAAWGNEASPDDVQEYIEDVTFDFDNDVHLPVTWMCLGTTKSGAPIHPLARGRNRVPDDAKLQVWRKPYAQD
jgi:hypothetical protein